jgi:hypothetical protein
MPINGFPSAKPFHPTTFQERGVAVPFTTPLLGGTRARLARRGLELIVHNPAGGRGVYVMHWSAAASFCRPTLHDKVLNSRLALLETVTPATVREAARAIAAEGLAGEAAMDASVVATETGEHERRLVRRHLLLGLIRQVDVVPGSSATSLRADSPELNTIAGPTIAWLARKMGQQPEWGIAALDALANVMARVGFGSGDASGEVSRRIDDLRVTAADIAGWIGARRDGDGVANARAITSMADVTATLAADLLTRVRARSDDMVSLLRDWTADPEQVRRFAARPEWVLDGWEQICLIWHFARDNATRRAALAEIAECVPMLPREIDEWRGGGPELDHLLFEPRPNTLNQDWITGAHLFDLIARNEQFRAVAA